MNRLTNAANRIVVLVLFLFGALALRAQEGGTKIDVDINKNGGSWYTNPVVWIIGAAVFILLLVALLRGNNSKS